MFTVSCSIDLPKCVIAAFERALRARTKLTSGKKKIYASKENNKIINEKYKKN